jgi:hypothetical protein
MLMCNTGAAGLSRAGPVLARALASSEGARGVVGVFSLSRRREQQTARRGLRSGRLRNARVTTRAWRKWTAPTASKVALHLATQTRVHLATGPAACVLGMEPWNPSLQSSDLQLAAPVDCNLHVRRTQRGRHRASERGGARSALGIALPVGVRLLASQQLK